MSDAFGAPNLTHRTRAVSIITGNPRDVKKTKEGRTCATWGCKTKLSMYNLDGICFQCGTKEILHGGRS